MDLRKNNVRVLAHHRDDYAEIFVREDNIVEVQLQSREYNGRIVESVVNTIKELTDNKKLLALIVASPNSQVTLDGVKSLFTREAVNHSMAKAYVLRRNSHFVITRVCMLLYQPTTPIRFFSSEQMAEQWLKSLSL